MGGSVYHVGKITCDNVVDALGCLWENCNAIVPRNLDGRLGSVSVQKFLKRVVEIMDPK